MVLKSASMTSTMVIFAPFPMYPNAHSDRPLPNLVVLGFDRRKCLNSSSFTKTPCSLPLQTWFTCTPIVVVIRIRPMRAEENEVTQVVHLLSPDTVAVIDQQFTFDAVAGMDSAQIGSRKTYTMWGPTCDLSGDQFPNKDRGLTPRVFEQLFARIQEEESKNIDKQLRYQCCYSFLEIYNEHIMDLLVPSQKNLQIREDVKTSVYVDNLTEEYVYSVDDVK